MTEKQFQPALIFFGSVPLLYWENIRDEHSIPLQVQNIRLTLKSI